MRLYLFHDFDRRLLPIAASKRRDWWEENDKTRNHAQHCLPLAMANSLGYYILSPLTFSVEWEGDFSQNATIKILEQTSHGAVDDHAAYGSFTVQPGFLPMTNAPGEFLFIKGIPNERALPYTCMEAVIEAWWNPATFGLVFLLNKPGIFHIHMGQPIAQMFAFRYEDNVANGFELVDGTPPEYELWHSKRNRSDYRKDLDYLRGLHPDGRLETTHIHNWREIGRVNSCQHEPSPVGRKRHCDTGVESNDPARSGDTDR